MQYVHITPYTQKLSDSELIAYRRGYQDGFDWGVLDNTYDHDSSHRHAYKTGYDAGVADFCDELDAGELA